MSKKKTLLVVAALVLICAVSIFGTAAYLQASTAAPVVNTFVYAGGNENFVDSLTIAEYKVTQDAAGKYTESASETVAQNAYKVVPGTTLPKHAFVTVTGKDAAPAYLYLEVVGSLNEVYTWSVDTANWTMLSGVTGNHGGTVYVYNGGGTEAAVVASQETLTVDILTGDKITVSDTATEAQIGQTSATLSFYAYLAQATIGENSDAATIYGACFPAPATGD